MVLDSVGKSLDGWPQNALLVVDRTARTLTNQFSIPAHGWATLVTP